MPAEGIQYRIKFEEKTVSDIYDELSELRRELRNKEYQYNKHKTCLKNLKESQFSKCSHDWVRHPFSTDPCRTLHMCSICEAEY